MIVNNTTIDVSDIGRYVVHSATLGARYFLKQKADCQKSEYFQTLFLFYIVFTHKQFSLSSSEIPNGAKKLYRDPIVIIKH